MTIENGSVNLVYASRVCAELEGVKAASKTLKALYS